MQTELKKLFRHGGSVAVVIPSIFAKNGPNTVIVQATEEEIRISRKSDLDTIETDPKFHRFIHALVHDAMKHPEKLHDVKEVWDKDWDRLLGGVKIDGG